VVSPDVRYVPRMPRLPSQAGSFSRPDDSERPNHEFVLLKIKCPPFHVVEEIGS
jgi:hypothetical protein